MESSSDGAAGPPSAAAAVAAEHVAEPNDGPPGQPPGGGGDCGEASAPAGGEIAAHERLDRNHGPRRREDSPSSDGAANADGARIRSGDDASDRRGAAGSDQPRPVPVPPRPGQFARAVPRHSGVRVKFIVESLRMEMINLQRHNAKLRRIVAMRLPHASEAIFEKCCSVSASNAAAARASFVQRMALELANLGVDDDDDSEGNGEGDGEDFDLHLLNISQGDSDDDVDGKEAEGPTARGKGNEAAGQTDR